MQLVAVQSTDFVEYMCYPTKLTVNQLFYIVRNLKFPNIYRWKRVF